MQQFLDNPPWASILFLVGTVLVFIGYLNGTVPFDDAFKDILYLGGGTGALGYVRNQAGKGLRPKTRK
jgi:hypothetical protein